MGLSTGRLLSMRNILFTAAGATFAPKLGIDGKLGAAGGGYMGAGAIGAVAGYVAAPFIQQLTGKFLGGGAAGGSDAYLG